MNYRKDLLFIINDVEQGTGSGGQQVLDNVAVAVAGGCSVTGAVVEKEQ